MSEARTAGEDVADGGGLRDDGWYECTADCPQGAVHEPWGCELCHAPEAPYLIDFGVWVTSYREDCARQRMTEGWKLSPKGKQFPEEKQDTLFG